MATNIYKINESINAYNETKAKIEKIKNAFYNELEGLEIQLMAEGNNIDYFKGLNREDCKKLGLVFI